MSDLKISVHLIKNFSSIYTYSLIYKRKTTSTPNSSKKKKKKQKILIRNIN